MSSFTPRPFRSFSVSDLFNTPHQPRREVLFRYVQGENLVTPQSRTINIVLSRDIRANVSLVNHMAVHMARKYPDRKIMVINTYAGPDLMKMTMRKALAAQVGDVNVPGMGQEQEKEDKQEQDAPVTQALFPNLYLLEVAYGTWNSWQIGREIREQGIDIVLWNSFEFSALSRFQRERIAVEMLKLQKELELSVIVFSHEMKRDIAPMMPARGAMGLLSAHAGTVWRIEEYDYAMLGLIEESVIEKEGSPAGTPVPRDGEMEDGMRDIHEKDMQVVNPIEHSILAPCPQRDGASRSLQGGSSSTQTPIVALQGPWN